MNLRNIVKRGIYIGANVLATITPSMQIKIPKRQENYKRLTSFSTDNPIYSAETFLDHPAEKKVDVSLVIPFYCAKQEYLETCLNSLVNQQTRYSFAIICIDDGSNDNTLLRLRKYQERYPELIHVHHQENAGISCARNKGIQISNSAYIGFIDQDDWVEQGYVEKLMNVAIDSNADVVKCSHKVVMNQKTISTYAIPDGTLNGKQDAALLEYSGMIWSGLYKKEILKKVRFPEKYWYEDMIARNLLYRCADIFASISDVLYVKRKHNENASTVMWTGKNSKCYDHLYLLKHLLEQNEELGLEVNCVLKKSILHELGQYLMWRTRGQEKSQRECAFYEACYIVQEYVSSTDGLSKLEIEYYKCFKDFDYRRWLLISWKDWAITK